MATGGSYLALARQQLARMRAMQTPSPMGHPRHAPSTKDELNGLVPRAPEVQCAATTRADTPLRWGARFRDNQEASCTATSSGTERLPSDGSSANWWGWRASTPCSRIRAM